MSKSCCINCIFCPLSFWQTLPPGVLSTSWCCQSIQAMHGLLACVHLALFLALSLFPSNSLVSLWCDHSMLVSLLWQCSYSSFVKNPLVYFFHTTESFQSFYFKDVKVCYFDSFFYSRTLLSASLVLSSVVNTSIENFWKSYLLISQISWTCNRCVLNVVRTMFINICIHKNTYSIIHAVSECFMSY